MDKKVPNMWLKDVILPNIWIKTVPNMWLKDAQFVDKENAQQLKKGVYSINWVKIIAVCWLFMFAHLFIKMITQLQLGSFCPTVQVVDIWPKSCVKKNNLLVIICPTLFTVLLLNYVYCIDSITNAMLF